MGAITRARKGNKQMNRLNQDEKSLRSMIKVICDNLYQNWACYSLIVEVTYNAKDNKITGINSFLGGETLEKYGNVPKEF